MASDMEGNGRSFLFLVARCAVALLVLYALWIWTGDESRTSWTVPAPVGTAPPPVGIAPPPVVPPAPAPEPEPLIVLESIDGRTISAHVLVVTDTSVFVRRDDGQKFDLPFTRLTPESKQRVMDARTRKIFGIKK